MESKILVEAGLFPSGAQTVLPILIPGLPEPNRKIEKDSIASPFLYIKQSGCRYSVIWNKSGSLET